MIGETLGKKRRDKVIFASPSLEFVNRPPHDKITPMMIGESLPGISEIHQKSRISRGIWFSENVESLALLQLYKLINRYQNET